MEWQAYDWALRLGGHPLKDKLIEKRGFGGRLAVLKPVIRAQPWPHEKTKQAERLWRQAEGFANFRNVIAHNPVISNRRHPGEFGLVDARDLKGEGRRERRAWKPELIYHVAERMQAHAIKLHLFWEREG